MHADAAQARKLGRRYAELGPVVAAARELATARDDEAAARELASEDPSFADEAREQHARVEALETRLAELLVPRDPHDGDDVIMEVKSGEGGEESALFAGDLVRMYLRYAERRGWKAEILGGTDSDLGGYKDATLLIRSRASDPVGVWAALKFEGGVHRVQRVPVTESQGRVHTSAAGVLVYPDTGDDAAVEIDDKDLRIDVFRSSGHGGQSVNTTDSAVRITHLPTGIVVSCQNERSQLQNRARAMEVLRSRLQALAEEEAAAKASADRRSQVRTVDRSERIRTYNFPENRISDHRIGYKAHNLPRCSTATSATCSPRWRRRSGPSRSEQGPSRSDMTRHPLRSAVREAENVLAAAGVASPRVDAELLAAHVVGVPRGRLIMVPLVDEPVLERYRELVERRAAREPLQHLLGTAVFGPVTVAVGPGVFTPRPETELLLEWGLKAIADVTSPLVVDLCTGSGALALGVAAARPDATVHAVEVDPAALAWARRNVEAHVAAGGTPVTVHAADVREPDLLPELRDPGRPAAVQPALRPRRHSGAAGGGRVGPAGRGVRRPGRPGDHPGGRDGGVGAAAARWRAGDRARRHPRRRGAGPAARVPGADGRRGAHRPGGQAPLRDRPPRPVGRQGPSGCSERGVRCVECTQRRFRYACRGIASRA